MNDISQTVRYARASPKLVDGVFVGLRFHEICHIRLRLCNHLRERGLQLAVGWPLPIVQPDSPG